MVDKPNQRRAKRKPNAQRNRKRRMKNGDPQNQRRLPDTE